MGSFIDGSTRTFESGATIAKHLRVVSASGVLGVAAITDQEDGTALAANVDGDMVSVRLSNAPGTVKMVASGAIAIDADVYTAADGKVSDTAASTSYFIGRAREAASGDGSIIEVQRVPGTNTAET